MTPAQPGQTTVENVSAERAQDLYDERQNLVVLDVRTPEEYNAGHIPGALNFDFRSPDFAQQIDQLDRTKPYLVHCQSGGRSTRSLEVFKDQQFQSIYHLDGGIRAWKEEGGIVTPGLK